MKNVLDFILKYIHCGRKSTTKKNVVDRILPKKHKIDYIIHIYNVIDRILQ